ncbi:hypothetical protein ABK040_010331 [Willaertia magna]
MNESITTNNNENHFSEDHHDNIIDEDDRMNLLASNAHENTSPPINTSNNNNHQESTTNNTISNNQQLLNFRNLLRNNSHNHSHNHRNFTEVNGFHIGHGSNRLPIWKTGLINENYTIYYIFLQLLLIFFKIESPFMFEAPLWVFGWTTIVFIPTYIMIFTMLISLVIWGLKDIIKWRRHYKRQLRRFERYRSRLSIEQQGNLRFRTTDPLIYSSIRSQQREKRKEIDRYIGYNIFIGLIIITICLVLISLKLDLKEKLNNLPYYGIFIPFIVYCFIECISTFIYFGIINRCVQSPIQLFLFCISIFICIFTNLLLTSFKYDQIILLLPFTFSMIPLFCINTALLLYSIIYIIRTFTLKPNLNKNNNIKEDNFMTISSLLITLYNGLEIRRRELNNELIENDNNLNHSQKKQLLKNRIDAMILSFICIPLFVSMILSCYYIDLNNFYWYHPLIIFLPILIPLFFICIYVTFRLKIINKYYDYRYSNNLTDDDESVASGNEELQSVRDILNGSEGSRQLRNQLNNRTTMSPLMLLYLHSIIRDLNNNQNVDETSRRAATLLTFLQEIDQMGTSRQSSQQQGLSTEFLSSLPTHIYKHDDDNSRDKENNTCPICLCEYEDGDELRTLPCFHIFHKECIDNWLQQKNTCAICKLQVDSYNEHQFLNTSPHLDIHNSENDNRTLSSTFASSSSLIRDEDDREENQNV